MLALDLPVHEYRTVKMILIPFDPRLSNGGKFANMREAMLFIGKHCAFHHHAFNKNLARLYLRFCRILSFVDGGYVSRLPVSDKAFNALFAEANRLFREERADDTHSQ
jgi:hypothetical protein